MDRTVDQDVVIEGERCRTESSIRVDPHELLARLNLPNVRHIHLDPGGRAAALHRNQLIASRVEREELDIGDTLDR